MTNTTETTTRPAYRAPWTNGAKAYPEADSFAAACAALKRKRSNVMLHMTNEGEAGSARCEVCGLTLREIAPGQKRPDLHSTWTYYAMSKAVGNGMHYVCSWSALLKAISDIKLYS